MERTHGELCTGLADRLSSDDANGLTLFDELAGGQREAIASRRDAEIGIIGERRENADPGDGGIVTQSSHLVFSDDGSTGVHSAIGQRDVIGQRAAEEANLEPGALTGAIGFDVLDPDTADRVAAGEGVLIIDDEFLGHVDESTGEVTGVRST